MKTRQLGKTGIELTELGFGGAAVGNLYRPTSRADAHAAIQAAWNAGIRYFDTSPVYGYGLSERRLGDALRDYPRSSYVLSTEVGRLLIPDATPKTVDFFPESLPFRVENDYSYAGIMRSFEHSLHRLGTDYIDLIYIHNINRATHGDAYPQVFTALMEGGGCQALAELQASRAVRAIGLGMSEWQNDMEIITQFAWDCFMLAGRYTLLEQSLLKTFFTACEKRAIPIIAAGPYNSGVLANGQYYNYTLANQKIMLRVNAIQKICDAYQIDLPHAALQLPLRHSQIVSVVVGARTEEQVALSVSYTQQSIPNRLWNALKEAALLAVDAPV